MPKKQKKQPKKQIIFTAGTPIEVRPDDEGFSGSWFEATVLNISPVQNPNSIFGHNNLFYNVEYKTLLAEDEKSLLRERVKAANIRPVPPLQNVKEDFTLNDVVEAFHLDGWWIGVITNVIVQNNIHDDNEKVYEVTFNNPFDVIKFRGSELRVHLDWIDGKWVRSPKLITYQSKSGETSLKRNKRRQSKILGENGGTENGLSSIEKTPVSGKGKMLATSDQTGMHSSKRQRTQNADSSSANVSNEVANVAKEKGLKVYCRTKDGVAAVNHQIPSSSRSSDTQHPSLLLTGIFLESTVQDLPDGISENGSGSTEQAVVSPAVAEGNRGEVINPNNELETVKKAVSVEPNDEKNFNFNHQNVIDHNNEKGEMEVRVSAVEGNGHLSDSYDQSLPFLKTCFNVWKDIESMEAFQAIPQKPHFQMLVNECPEAREGKAIGYMITFSSIAKKVTELRLDDPRGSIGDCLKKLVKLEKNGFDVKAIRDRLNWLLSKKDEYDNLLIQFKEHENQIIKHNCEKVKVLEEIGRLDKQIKELQEKHDLAFSMREDMENKITCLELKLKSAREEMDKFSALKEVAAFPR